MVLGSTLYSTWDAAGNMTGDGAGLGLNHHLDGSLASASQYLLFGTYASNAQRQRTAKTVLDFLTFSFTYEFWMYDEQGRLIGRYDPSGTTLEELVYLDGFRPVATIRGSDIDRVLADHLGTPRKVLDPTGSLLWSWDAKEPFGNSAPVGVGGFTFDLRFPGQILDSESGLVHNGFREYHPGAGRYVESDPLGLAAGLNTYSYVYGSPLSGTDESGLFESSVWLRASVPGQVFFDQGMTAIENGEPLLSAGYFGSMLAEQMMFVASLGGSAPANIAIKEAGPVCPDATQNVVTFTRSKLQHTFKHAKDFGVEGKNANNQTMSDFSSAIDSHINSEVVDAIQGTYRGDPVTHYLNRETGLNAMVDQEGAFVSGWRLNEQQYGYVTTTGKLGGGR